MSDSGRAVDAGALRARLPTGWTVETVCEGDEAGDCADGQSVRGYADSGELGGREKADGRGAAFEIRQCGELWTAILLDRRGPSADRAAERRVTGVRERCVEWVVELARGLEGADDE